MLARRIDITPEKTNGEWLLHYRVSVGDTFVMDGTARTMGDAVGRIVSFAVDGGLLREYEWEKPPAQRSSRDTMSKARRETRLDAETSPQARAGA